MHPRCSADARNRDFGDLGSYRAFIDEIVSRRNAAHGKRIDAKRTHLQALADRRTTDFEEVIVTVSSTGGFALRKLFYTVPSRLIGHRLRCVCSTIASTSSSAARIC